MSMSLWRRTVSKCLYPMPYASVLRRAASSNPEWFWLRTHVGYFSVTKTGQLRKTNFSGGAPRAEFNEINNNDGTISYKVSKGKFKDYFINLESDRVGLDLDPQNAASFKYDSDTLELILKANNSDLNNSQLYVNRNTGYFYFGFDDLDKYNTERERWANPKGIEKLGLTPHGWMKSVIDGYEKCALRIEKDNVEHSPGLI
mmetsp:Transcript_21160/g.18652  ORF Transcript_21160/g.18652 Transcript_21160/m.18652 type:complete len:201 (+) Transcript_21160:31-633(+)